MNNKSEEFKNRILDFTVKMIKELKKLPRSQENKVFFIQVVRSASSIGANYQEARNAHSRKEFGQKLSISLKEATETIYWLELIERVNSKDLGELKEESISLTKILTASVKKIKTNIKYPISHVRYTN